MIRLFLDTNVILDLIISDRDGHQGALDLENFANTHPCKLSCTWHSLSIIEYIGRKRFGSEAIHLLLRNLLDTFTVPSAGTDEAKQAFNYLAGDFEDALQISAPLPARQTTYSPMMPADSQNPRSQSSLPKNSFQC